MTAESAIPDVIDALVTLARVALPDVKVVDGYDVSDGAGDVLMVGVEDPELDDMAYSAQAEHVVATMGPQHERDEAGSITCVAVSTDGGGNMKTARDGAFTTVSAVATICRTNPTLGIASLLRQGGGAMFGAQVRLLQNQNEEDGAVAFVIFDIGYKARL